MNKVHNTKEEQRNWQHILLKNQSDCCIACIFRFPLFVSAILGATCVKPSCPHTDTNLSKPVFYQTVLYSVIPIVYMIINLVLICKDVYELRSNTYLLTDFFAQFIIQIIVCKIYLFAIGLCLFLNTPSILCELNLFSAIISNSKLYGISEMFSFQTIRSLERQSMIYSIMGILITLVHFVVCLKAYTVLEAVLICVTFSTVCMMGIQIIVGNIVGMYLLEKCFAHTKDVLNERLAKEQSLTSIRIKQMFHARKMANESMSILHKIQKLQRLYCAIIDCIQIVNEYLNPVLLISIVGLTAILSHEVYLLLRLWLTEELSTNVYGMILITRFTLIMSTLSVTFIKNHAMNTTVSTY